jgi:DNA-binding HxlR family transcriptional regulator
MDVSVPAPILVPGKRRKAGRTGCAVEATLSVIGGVWKPVLLFHLLDGKLRFNALCRLTPSATPRMITLQLRELEADGIVRRTVYPEGSSQGRIRADHPRAVS